MPFQPCWNSSKRKKTKNGLAGTPASPKNQKDGLLELQQARKIKKMACWNSSKAKNQKNRAAGTPASQKMRQTLARLPYDGVKQWCQRLRHNA